MRYGNCRGVDIQATDKDQIVVVVPTGALEQHGRHLPLLTDAILVTEVAERVEKKLSDQVLLVPTLWLGASDHHLDFPGTLSLPNTVYAEMIKHVLQCCVGAGFRRIMFLNGHFPISLRKRLATPIFGDLTVSEIDHFKSSLQST